MKRLIYCIIIAMSISLAFSQGKPCCNKKAGKNVVSCKFNHVTLGTDKDILGELTTGDSEGSSKSYKCNAAYFSKWAKCDANKPWWKFWAKKSNCPCRQADATETSTTG